MDKVEQSGKILIYQPHELCFLLVAFDRDRSIEPAQTTKVGTAVISTSGGASHLFSSTANTRARPL